MRKRNPHSNVSPDRWLVSYADLITLLFALFVILYATSQAKIEKFKAVHQSLREAFDGKSAKLRPSESGTITDGSGKQYAEDSLEHIKNLLEQGLLAQGPQTVGEPAISEVGEKVHLLEDERGLVVRLAAKDFFDDGSAEPRSDLSPLLMRIGRVLAKLPNDIRVEGFTDTIEEKEMGKHHDVWASDWELSSARATGVVRIWIEQLGIDPKRLGAAGFAHFRPLTQKTDNWSRGLNRRIEVIVLKAK